ncbi:MAG: LysR family transcriptional regulator [Granulosicoccus sp.]|nr:LysR family transcriptional regulator [Granulosicoccus sp.]
MDRLPLTALRAFSAIYSAGGVRAAERELYVSHSAISRHLRELESLLGVPLVERGSAKGGQLAFTREGHVLGQGASECFGKLASVVTAVREGQRDSAVTVATTPSIAARWLLPRLPQLSRQYPWLEVSVIADQRPRAPSDDGADLAIRMTDRPAPLDDNEPLMDDVLYPVLSPDAWAGANHSTDLDWLARRVGLLHDRDQYASWLRWCEATGSNTSSFRMGARFTSSDLVLDAAERGLGLALARGRLADEAVNAGRLVRPLGSQSVPLPDAYWLVGRADGEVREAVKVFAEWLRATVRDSI